MKIVVINGKAGVGKDELVNICQTLLPRDAIRNISAIDYVKEVLVYDEDNRIIAEFFLDEEEYPDARERIKDDVDEFNRNMPLFKNY